MCLLGSEPGNRPFNQSQESGVLGDVENSPPPIERMETTGYISALKQTGRDTDFVARFRCSGHDCMVVAPTLIPKCVIPRGCRSGVRAD